MNVNENTFIGEIDPERIKGLLFDVDGTLSDTDDHLVHRIARRLSPVSFLFADRDPSNFARWMVMGIETPANFMYTLADRVGLDNALSNVYSHISQRRRAKRPEHDWYWIVSGVEKMLADLHQRYSLGIVSARDEITTMRFLEHCNLLSYFDVVITAQSTRNTKPFPDPVIHAAEQMGLDPESCVMIGDTIVDIKAGKAAGAQTIGVLCGFGSFKGLLRAEPDLIVPATPDICKFLK